MCHKEQYKSKKQGLARLKEICKHQHYEVKQSHVKSYPALRRLTEMNPANQGGLAISHVWIS